MIKNYLKRLFKIKRYFLVSYQCVEMSGSSTYVSCGGKFFSVKHFMSYIGKICHVDTSNGFNLMSVLEISKQDYDDYGRGAEK